MDRPSAFSIALRGVSKSYGATKALSGTDIHIPRARVHALLGENGAGKSTIIKILSGIIRPDEGNVLVDDKPVDFGSPRDAHAHGVHTAFQELALVPSLPVWQNLWLPYLPTNVLGQVRFRWAKDRAASFFDDLGLNDINIRQDVGSLSLNIRQKIEIARAVFRQPKVLLLDEATSAMSTQDVNWLEALIRRLRASGVTVVLITHRMAEVRRFCDDVTVLRNGKSAGQFQVDQVDDEELIERIVGRTLAAVYPKQRAFRPHGAPLLAINDASTATGLNECSLSINKGEILGIAALQGMGQRDLFMALFGAIPLTAGTIEIDGRVTKIGSPSHAVALGIGLVPEERKTEGLLLTMSGADNVALPSLSDLSRVGLIAEKDFIKTSLAVMNRVQVDPRALTTNAGHFSGGNQQKLVLARWLVANNRLLLLLDPTRGVDIGTKSEIYRLIRQFVEDGGTVLFYSSEIPELVHLCDRVLVLYRGTVSAAFEPQRGGLDERSIMSAALGNATVPAADAPYRAEDIHEKALMQ